MLNFVNLLLLTAFDGTNTQRIEASWRPAKDFFRGRNVQKAEFAEYVVEYLWRRHCRINKIDTMESLLSAFRAHYGDFRINA